MIVVSVCLPSDAFSQFPPSYLGFSYLGCGVPLHGCSSKMQPLLLTLDWGNSSQPPPLTLAALVSHCSHMVRDIVQETGIKTIPKKKKCRKAKWLSEEALQIAVKRREVKNKGEKEKYKHLNAEFQRIARRDKKAFFSDQCKKIEENNRMGKTRDLFKKIRDTKGTFHTKMGLIRDRNGMDLTEAEAIKKRWQEYTEELYKKDLQKPDMHDGVITNESQTSWNEKSSGP